MPTHVSAKQHLHVLYLLKVHSSYQLMECCMVEGKGWGDSPIYCRSFSTAASLQKFHRLEEDWMGYVALESQTRNPKFVGG